METQRVISPLPTRNNEIEIYFKNWDCVCTQIDWASIEIRAMSPVILVHGIGGGPSTFTSFGMADELADYGLVSSKHIHEQARFPESRY